MDIINVETITGTVTADSLREGAIKINNNFNLVTQSLIDIQNVLCNIDTDICNLHPKLSITVDVSDFQYTPIEVGNVLFHSGSGYDLALAELSDAQEAIGIIHYIDNDKVYITLDGYLCNQQGLSAGTQYYLSNSDPGKVITLSDATTCDVLKPIYTAISPTEAIVNIMKSSLIGIEDFNIYNFPREEYVSYNELKLEPVIEQAYPWLNIREAIAYNEFIVELAVTAQGLPVKIHRAYSFNETTLEICTSGAEPEFTEIRDMVNYSEFGLEPIIIAPPHTISDNLPLINYSEVSAELLIESTVEIPEVTTLYNYSNISAELVTIP